MTKQLELALLDEFLAELSKRLERGSYLYAPLKDLRLWIESQLRSDIEPDIVGAVRDRGERIATLEKEIDILRERVAELKQAEKSARSCLDLARTKASCVVETSESLLNFARRAFDIAKGD